MRNMLASFFPTSQQLPLSELLFSSPKQNEENSEQRRDAMIELSTMHQASSFHGVQDAGLPLISESIDEGQQKMNVRSSVVMMNQAFAQFSRSSSGHSEEREIAR
jgi:hypothetical protein